jgi:dual specificity tyrosine-phosphorylation-regulated kinase 2/3/4
MKKNQFKGFQMNLIRRLIIQILQALRFLAHHQVIHCDLKPENILLKEYNKSGIKMIDFGSGCFLKNKLYTYI